MPKKFKSQKVRAHEVLEDDCILFNGNMYRVTTNSPVGYGSNRRHITAYRLGRDPHYDRVAFMTDPNLKIKIYNQK